MKSLVLSGFRRNFVRKLLDDHTIKRRPTFFKYHMTLIDLMEAKKATRAERLTRKLILKMLRFDEKHA